MSRFDEMINGLQKETKIPEQVWKIYTDALSRLPDKPDAGTRRFPVKRTAILAAAAVVAVSALGVSAAVYMKWSRALDEGMAATSEQRQKLEESQMASFIEQSVTQGDITVTAEQSIVDDYFALLSFRVEGYQVEEGQQPGFDNIWINVGEEEKDDSYTGGWSAAFYDGLLMGADGKAVHAKDGMPLQENENINYTMEDGSMEFLVTLSSNQKGDFIGKPIHVELKDLGVYSGKAMPVTVEKEGTWSFDWTLTGSTERKTYELNVPLGESGATLLQAQLSPISMVATYDFPRQEETETALDADGKELECTVYKEPPYFTGVRLKDGTLLTGLGAGGSMGYSSADSDVYETIMNTERILDVDQVESLLFIKSAPDGEQPLTEENLYIVPIE